MSERSERTVAKMGAGGGGVRPEAVCLYARMHICMHACARTRTRTHTYNTCIQHTRTHTHTHIHTHTHTHTHVCRVDESASAF